MINNEVMKHLLKHTEIEQKQLNSGKFVNDFLPKKTNEPVLNKKLLKKSSLRLSKHNRFAAYPRHKHDFIEINYMVNGSCQEIVNDTQVTLNQGDLLVMASGCEHEIAPLGENDILVNLLFTDTSLSLNFLQDIRLAKSRSYKFFMDIALDKSDTSHYWMMFKNNTDIIQTVDEIINECVLNRQLHEAIITSYLNVLIAKIVRQYPELSTQPTGKHEELISNILHTIREDYNKVSLDELATKFSYSRNYISNLIKKETGKTFMQLRTEYRLNHAREMIISSNLPIDEISDHVGCYNHNTFFRKYKQRFNCMPKDTRQAGK